MKAKIIFVAAAWIVAPSLADSATMKAIVAHEYGGPEVLKYEDVSRPERKEDEILVRVIAAGVNPVDGMIRSGMFAKDKKLASPMILGGDIAGVVEKTGGKITKFKKGDSIYAYLSLKNNGGYAEYAVAKEKEAAAKPKSISYDEAAAVPIVALTAWQALVDSAKLGAGQSVLIHGGVVVAVTASHSNSHTSGGQVFSAGGHLNLKLLRENLALIPLGDTQRTNTEPTQEVEVVLDSVGGDTLI